jgi:NADPH2:quinone reductase
VRRGDRVAYAGIGPGSYAELRTVPEEKLVPLPEGCDDALVAATLQQGITAYFLLHEVYPLKAGDTILFHAAAGGVGTIACQWAQRLGATVIGTAGCAAVIDYRHEDVAERVRAITGGTGVAAVFDSVGRDTFEGSLASLRPYGTLVSFGSSSGDPPPLDINRLGEKGSLYLTRPRFVHYARRREDLLRMAQAYFAFLDDPRTQVAIGRRFALAEAADAHRAMQRRETIGSSVLVP